MPIILFNKGLLSLFVCLFVCLLFGQLASIFGLELDLHFIMLCSSEP